MTERWIVNASPLIILAKIGYQHLLVELTDELLVPQTVVDEINVGPADDAARLYLSAAPLTVVSVDPDPVVQAWDLGTGETAVLSYARTHPEGRVVVDDRAARRCAHALGIPLVGTLGVILRARKANLIPAPAPLLKSLQAHGFRLNDTVIRLALQQTTGEIWP